MVQNLNINTLENLSLVLMFPDKGFLRFSKVLLFKFCAIYATGHVYVRLMALFTLLLVVHALCCTLVKLDAGFATGSANILDLF